jgi:hypothetical protein
VAGPSPSSLPTLPFSQRPPYKSQVEDFDEGVVHQLNAKRTWEEAAEAVRHLASYDLAPIQHPAAYINHIIKHTPGAANGTGSASAGAPNGQIRLASVPISTKVRRALDGLGLDQRRRDRLAATGLVGNPEFFLAAPLLHVTPRLPVCRVLASPARPCSTSVVCACTAVWRRPCRHRLTFSGTILTRGSSRWGRAVLE